MLRTPALIVPQSLSGQLEYIRQHWAKYLGKFLYRLLGSLDLIKEEERAIFRWTGTHPCPGLCEPGPRSGAFQPR